MLLSFADVLRRRYAQLVRRSVDLDLIARDWPTELTGPIADLDDLLARWRTVDRQRFIMRGDGSVDVRVNAFLSSARMRTLASTTNRDYAQSLCLWLNFLQTKGSVWSEATADDVEHFDFWRRTDPNNSAPVGASAFSKDVAACKKFYSWAAERFSDVIDIYAGVEPPPPKRSARAVLVAGACWTATARIALGRHPNGRPSPITSPTSRCGRQMCDSLRLSHAAVRTSPWRWAGAPQLDESIAQNRNRVGAGVHSSWEWSPWASSAGSSDGAGDASGAGAAGVPTDSTLGGDVAGSGCS